MKWFVPLIFSIFLLGCTKNEVKLNFDLPASYHNPCRILYYSTGKEESVIRETVAEISEGKGELILSLKQPSIVYLFSPSSKYPAIILYVVKGDNILIKGDSENVEDWKVTGSKVSEEVNEWRLKNLKLIRERQSDPSALNEAVAQYIKAHPDSQASAIILYFYYNRRDHIGEFYKLQALLDKDVLDDDRLMAALSMPDLITEVQDIKSLPKQIVLTVDSGYADTLKLAHGKATMMIFRNTFPLEIPMDSIKSLIRRNKGKKNVAEVYMETDSMTWRRFLRGDTIKDFKRMWMPLGLADSLAIRMGVNRIPLFIISNGKGKEIYRGSDWAEAKNKFENLTP